MPSVEGAPTRNLVLLLSFVLLLPAVLVTSPAPHAPVPWARSRGVTAAAQPPPSARPAAAALPSGGLWSDAMPWPWAMWGPSMAYDPAAGRLLLFGGYGPDGSSADTWSYDPGANTWTNLRPGVHPPARYGGLMDYDGRADRLVLFGGMASDYGPLNDTWAFDYANDTWTLLHPAQTPQEDREGGFVYDARADRFLLFGGCFQFDTPFCAQMNQTWSYDLANDTWSLLTVSADPGPLSDFALAYSPAWDRTILYGGIPPNCCTVPGPISGATFAFDYANRTWKDLAPATPPPGILDQSLAYDARAHRMIMAGGDQGQTPNTFTGTFAFDYANESWATLSPSGAPGPFSKEAMAYDPALDRTLLFTAGGPLGPVWRFDYPADAWAEGNVPLLQPAEQRPVLAFDSAADRLVFFGGCTGATNGCDNQTWWFDVTSGTWTQRLPATAPGPRTASAFGYDSRDDRVVLFGGTDQNFELGDTWTYDAANDTWAKLHPATSPAARDDAAAAYDPRADRLVVFGGEVSLPNVTYLAFANDTWSFDLRNDTWTNLTPPSGPSPRTGARLAYDAVADRFVLFGGLLGNGEVSGETWIFDLAAERWTNVTGAVGPPARWDGELAYDAAAGRSVLFGGVSTLFPDCIDLSCYDGDTWAYDAANGTWTSANPSPSPSPRRLPSAAYVSSEGVVDLLGGNEYIRGTYADFWSYEYGPSVPTWPLAVQAVSGASVVSLSWSPPASGGDSAITGYRVYRNATGNPYWFPTLLATISSGRTYEDTGVVNLVWYGYAVSAVNAVGEGPQSAPAGAIPGPAVSLSSVTGRSGASLNLTGRVDDESTGTWSLSFGDGSLDTTGTYGFGSTPIRVAHVYASGGTYTVTLQASHGLRPAVASATATIAPAALRLFTVTFVETGLVPGTNWSVTLNGTSHATTGRSIAFTVPSGTYAFEIPALAGYSATPASGALTVAGANASQSITYTATGPASAFSGWEGYAAVALVVTAAAVLTAVIIWRRSRAKESRNPPEDVRQPRSP